MRSLELRRYLLMDQSERTHRAFGTNERKGAESDFPNVFVLVHPLEVIQDRHSQE